MGFYELVKDAVNMAQKADNIELYRMLLDANKGAIDLIDENSRLKDRIRELEEKLKLEKSVVYREDAYYIQKEEGILDGPFCRGCWDKDRKLIRMSKFNSGQAGCLVCDFIAKKIL